MRWYLNGAFLIYLIIAAWKDIKEKKVSVWLAGVFALLAVTFHMFLEKGDIRWAAGVFPGLFLLGLAWVSGQAVGYGDGCVLTVIGLYLGFAAGISILMTGLLLLCPVSLGVLLWKKDRKRTLPFVPFLLAGYLIWLMGG